MLIWAVSDGRAGNHRQAEALGLAVARRVGGQFESITLQPRRPWRDLSPRWLPWAARGFDPAFTRELQAARPALVIGCGRQAALATRIARHLLGTATRCVQILDPRLGRNAWDLMVLPRHDRPDAADDPFIVPCTGSLHPIDDRWLQAVRDEQATLGTLPGPRLVLLLGGPTRHCPWGEAELAAWLDRLLAWRRQAGSLLLVAAPRTPPLLRQRLAGRRQEFDLCWLQPADGANPYAAALAWADVIVASPDSVNQLSEAAATRVPLLLPSAPVPGARLAKFHAALLASGRAESLGARPPSGMRSPLRDTDAIAAALIERLRLPAAS